MRDINRNENTDWDAIRAEYVAGGINQRQLAVRHGVSYRALSRRATAEKWVAARDEAARIPGAEPSNAEIAVRLRKKLLMRLERVTDAIPDGAVTELKAQDDGKNTLFKLRDLTAAYKDLADDPPEGKGRETDVEDLSPLAELLK